MSPDGAAQQPPVDAEYDPGALIVQKSEGRDRAGVKSQHRSQLFSGRETQVIVSPVLSDGLEIRPLPARDRDQEVGLTLVVAGEDVLRDELLMGQPVFLYVVHGVQGRMLHVLKFDAPGPEKAQDLGLSEDSSAVLRGGTRRRRDGGRFVMHFTHFLPHYSNVQREYRLDLPGPAISPHTPRGYSGCFHRRPLDNFTENS